MRAFKPFLDFFQRHAVKLIFNNPYSCFMPEEPRLNIAKYFYLVLLIIGVVFYISWGILYDGWFDRGVYAVTIVLVGFGVTGVLLYSHIEK